MQNKINLDTHNELITVSEPWHRGSGFTWMLLALAGVVFFLTGAVAKAGWEDLTSWKSDAGSSNLNSDSWYNNTRGWDWHNPNYEGYRNLNFDNNHQLTMNNNFSGDGARRWRVTFAGGATSDRQIGGSTENTFNDISGHGGAIIANNSTGNHTINFPIKLNSGLEVNPVSGNLTLGGTINLQGNYLSVYGNNEKILRINGGISGAGGINVEQNSTLEIAGDNSFSGNTTINAGKIKMISGGDLGTSLIQVGANGQFDLNGVNTTVSGVKEVGTSNGGTVSLGSGTLTINGANKGTLFQNSISGTGGITMAGSGDTSLSLYGTQSYTGATTVSGGKISSGTALASTSYTVSGGTMETSADSVIANNSAISISGTGNFSVGGNDTIGTVTATGGKLTVADGKTAILSGNSSIGSSSEILGPGTIQVGTATANSGTLTLNSTDADNTSALSVASGGTLSGTFRTSGALSVDGVLAPGNSTGTSYAGNTTFLGGGNYEWEIDNFTGSAGSSWDFLSITGTLTISATSADRFLIDVISLLSASDLPGLASNFSDGTNYSFAIATASGGVSGWAADKFDINTSGFQNAFTGTWGTSVSGNSLNITYTAATAIPEPSSAALTLIGLGVLALRRRCG